MGYTIYLVVRQRCRPWKTNDVPPRSVNLFGYDTPVLGIDHLAIANVHADMRDAECAWTKVDQITLFDVALWHFLSAAVLSLSSSWDCFTNRLLVNVLGEAGAIEVGWASSAINVAGTKVLLSFLVNCWILRLVRTVGICLLSKWDGSDAKADERNE